MDESTKFDRAVSAAMGLLATGEDLTKPTLRRALGERLANAEANAAIKRAREQFAPSHSMTVATGMAPSAAVADPNVREVTAAAERGFARVRAEEQARCEVLLRDSRSELDKALALVTELRTELAAQVAKTAKAEKELKEVRRALRTATKEAKALQTLTTLASQLRRVRGSGTEVVHSETTA